MDFGGKPPRFTFVTALVATVLLGLTFGFSGPGAAGRGGASIELTKTVGIPPGCDADSLTITRTTTVLYCYEVENTGIQSFITHTLVDDRLGTLLLSFPFVLNPGGTFLVSRTAQISETTINNATWTAFGSPDDAVGTDSAMVEVVHPAIELIKTVGTEPGVCAAQSSISVPLPASVTYCYEAHNVGDVAFRRHDLVDDRLGVLLDDERDDLAPGQFLRVLATTVISQTTVNSATWTARDPFLARDTATATVLDGVIFMDGFESGDTSAWQ